ncbi:DUF4810 domain-containing protein [Ferrimonas balearica]|uniref:DUF4810 domain-containing protein n=1 Tax=Ferrimonas balearica TaxID=44012 RepID=UPI001C59BB66|nr:DUF4810 domain-containing protein [Ferrimonas balearica]MBW3141239.1 DUF4810 domain-containing protein [Ferrimonas balearica]MBY6108272.1 DUF4810 domain-containing protein [Ferrimonas balearica]
MKKNTFLSILLSLLLVGCATQQELYQWGEYEQALYKQQSSPEELKVYVESLQRTIEAGGKPVAPGLYAELGSAYLQAGDVEQAIHWYGVERDTWPESKALMTVLITNLERRLPSNSASEEPTNAMD